MMTCKEATHLISDGQDRKLRLSERILLRIHLALCSGCSRYDQQLHLIRQACNDLFGNDRK
jgi:hypothetical protein